MAACADRADTCARRCEGVEGRRASNEGPSKTLPLFQRRLEQPRISLTHSASRACVPSGFGGAMPPSTRATGPTPSTTSRFFGCYLVGSQNPVMKGKSYVGFTVDPPRRLRQHNGVLSCGAKYTRRLRPCVMLLVVHGFPSKVQALQFEWAWQKPRLSRAVRETAQRLGVSDKSSSILNKTKLVMAMLSLSPWCHLPLTVHFFCPETREIAASTVCAETPEHMEMTLGDLAFLTANAGPFKGRDETGDGDDENETVESDDDDVITPSEASEVSLSVGASNWRYDDEVQSGSSGKKFTCGVCHVVGKNRKVGCPGCVFTAHASCLASSFLAQATVRATETNTAPPSVQTLIPPKGRCPHCDRGMSWGSALAAGLKAGAGAATSFGSVKNTTDRPPSEAVLASIAEHGATKTAPLPRLDRDFYGDVESSSSDESLEGEETIVVDVDDETIVSNEASEETPLPLAERLSRRAGAENGNVMSSRRGTKKTTPATDAGLSPHNHPNPVRVHISLSP